MQNKRARACFIDPKAKARIREIIENRGSCSKEEAREIVRPYAEFDPKAMEDFILDIQINRIFAGPKDKKKVRKYLNYKNAKGESIFVNIDTSRDRIALAAVNEQITKKFNGIKKTRKKVNKRQNYIVNQITFDFIQKEENND